MNVECIAHTAHRGEPTRNGRWRLACVRAAVSDAYGRHNIGWWPIIGRWHEDADIIGFAPWHWHVDWRFVDEAGRDAAGRAQRPLSAKVLTATMIRPIGEHRTDEAVGAGAPAALPNAAPEWWFRHELREPNENAPNGWPHTTMWLGALEERYAQAKLGRHNARICPHRGADLEGFALPGANTVTCPLHGLRWNIESGQLSPRTSTARTNTQKEQP